MISLFVVYRSRTSERGNPDSESVLPSAELQYSVVVRCGTTRQFRFFFNPRGLRKYVSNRKLLLRHERSQRGETSLSLPPQPELRSVVLRRLRKRVRYLLLFALVQNRYLMRSAAVFPICQWSQNSCPLTVLGFALRA